MNIFTGFSWVFISKCKFSHGRWIHKHTQKTSSQASPVSEAWSTIEVLLLPPHPPLDGTTREGGYHIKLMGMPLVSLRHRIWRFWSPLRVLHTSKDRRPINVSLWVVSNKIHCTQVVDPGEGPGGAQAPLIFRPKWGPKSRKKTFLRLGPHLISTPPLIWRSGSATLYPYKKENAVGWDGSPLKPVPCIYVPWLVSFRGLILIF